MSVDTKAFVCCNVKDNFYNIMYSLIKNINKKSYSKYDSRHIICSCNFYNINTISITFPYGEKRMLSVHTDCSYDYSDTYKGEKMIFSIGCWGHSKEIINIVCNTINNFGDTYVCYNDVLEGFIRFDNENIYSR